MLKTRENLRYCFILSVEHIQIWERGCQPTVLPLMASEPPTARPVSPSSVLLMWPLMQNYMDTYLEHQVILKGLPETMEKKRVCYAPSY